MTSAFLHFLNLSITAGWMVLGVLLLRLCLKKAPRWITCVLWGLVALRLVLPFSIESPVSLIPTAKTVVSTDTTDVKAPVVDSGLSAIDKPLNDWLQTPVEKPTQSPVVQSPVVSSPSDAEPGEDTTNLVVPNDPKPENPTEGSSLETVKTVSRAERILQIAAPVWLVGIGLMLAYELISFLRVRARVWDAVRLRDNVWQSDRVASPFIFGLFRPRIYVPYDLDEPVLAQVLSHERAHLHRRDHWIKPFAFTLLAVYWYNPLLWVGYVLLCRDIEVACDERVVRVLDADNRRQYAAALLECGVERRSIAACPLAFGEVSIKQRIKSVLNYRKPLLWVIIVSLVVCSVAAVCLLTVPKSVEPDSDEETVVVLSSASIAPDQERYFYGTDTDGALIEEGVDFMWENAENPHQRTPDIDYWEVTDVPLVVSRSKADLNALMDACSDETLQVDMRGSFDLEKYDDTYFEDKVIVWLFVPGYDLATYDYAITLEKTDKGLRYAVTLQYESTSMFHPWPGRCEYLFLFETDRKVIEEAKTLTTRHEQAPYELPTELTMLSVGSADVDGDGQAEDIRVYHSALEWGTGWDSGYETAYVAVCKRDGTVLLLERTLVNTHSQCYLVPREDGSSLLLLLEAGDVEYAYSDEEFGVLSLKGGERTVLDDEYESMHPTGLTGINFGNLASYVLTLSDWLDNAQLLYECDNGTIRYGDALGIAAQYQPMCWLDEYRDGDDDTVQDILENILASLGGETVSCGETDFDGDGNQEKLSVVRYVDEDEIYQHSVLVVRRADDSILAATQIHCDYVDETYGLCSYVYRMKTENGYALKMVDRYLNSESLSVYDLTVEGNIYLNGMTMEEWLDYVEDHDGELLFYFQGLEMCFPNEEASDNFLNEDVTKYAVENYNPSIVAYNAFLKGQRVAHEYGDLDTMLYVTDLYATWQENGIRSYTLADVTGDGVPELITSGVDWNIFTYRSGRLLRLYQSAAGMYPTRLLSNGCLWEERLGGGNNYRYTKFFEIGTTYTVEFGDPGYDTDEKLYHVDGVWMNKADFDAKTSAYFEASDSPALLMWYDYATKQPTSEAMVQYLSLLNDAYYGADVYYALHDADGDGTSELLVRKQDDVIIGLPQEDPTITNMLEEFSWKSTVENPLQLLDVTVDGYSDVLVEYNESARGKQYAFLRWDTEKERLVMIPTIIYNPAFDSETAVIRSNTHGDEIVSYGMYRYDAQTEDLICTHSLYFEENEQAIGDSDRMKLVVTENGVEKTLYVRGEPYGLDKTDPQVAPYYAPDSFWNLDSLQWENYVGTYVSDYVHILQRNHSETDSRYAVHDMDGDGWEELLVLEGTKLTVYARSEQEGLLRVLVEQDFQTATSRFLMTGDDHYPGLIYVCIGGGKEWYYYLSLDNVENDAFVFAPLWTDNYADFGKDEDGRITVMTEDLQLVAVSRDATSVPFVGYDL